MGAFVCTVISLKGPTKEATSVSHLLSAVKEHQLSRAMRYLHTKLDTLPKWKQISSRKQKLKQASSGKEGVKSEEGNKIEPKTAKDDQDPKIAIAEQGGQLVEGENDLDHLNERMEEMALELKDHNDAVGLDGTVSHFPLEEWETVTLSVSDNLPSLYDYASLNTCVPGSCRGFGSYSSLFIVNSNPPLQ